jgi:hypothetical protein
MPISLGGLAIRRGTLSDNEYLRHTSAPEEHQYSDPDRGTHQFENNVTRNFENSIWNEEDCYGCVVLQPVHV